MKKIFLLTAVIFLSACNTGGPPPATPVYGDVTVEGDIKNQSLAWQNYVPDIFKHG